MSLKLFKFGGASIRDAEHIKNIGTLIGSAGDTNILLVVSAMGKTTNALEKCWLQFFEVSEEQCRSCIDEIITRHLNVAEDLGVETTTLKSKYNEFTRDSFNRLRHIAYPLRSMVYDQLVSLGELFSTYLLYLYLKLIDFDVLWIDIRRIIITDDNYQDARIDWALTQANVNRELRPLIQNHKLVITQGFIAGGENKTTTTLGREGSDYTAAVLASCVDLEELTVWKDVPGILTADPRKFEKVEKLDELSYREAIELSYYGAQVIHPKTIRPLQNKSIRLNVRCFYDPDAPGTVICGKQQDKYPPMVVIQNDVVILEFSSRDFSFIGENHLSHIFQTLDKYNIRLCTMRNSAISFTMSIKNPGDDKLAILVDELKGDFNIKLNKGLDLYSIRHYNESLLAEIVEGRKVLFKERLRNTIQLIMTR